MSEYFTQGFIYKANRSRSVFRVTTELRWELKLE